ncbi:MAG: phosphate acyltransferase PlsX [Verrucomicrobia bacterium]|nr:phosphate acyltransferase PlsX [Verrucomicrobiota bacterium]
MRIAVDAMGGDYAPAAIVEGAVSALRHYKDIEELFLVGDETTVRAECARHGRIDPRITFVHASQIVSMSDSAVEGVRRKKDSSVSRAVDLVKEGRASAIVSAGHTGAAVAATTIKLRLLEGVDRPGIATVMPTEHNLFVLIDAGANIEAKPIHLLQYGVMGSLYSRHVLGYQNPRVGLMSIGEEDVKGNDLTKETFKLLERSTLNFVGNVEGNDVFEGNVEVIVCDGFVGNVVLKTAESLANALFHWLKTEVTRTLIRKAGGMLVQNAFRAIRRKTDYAEYGGAPLLGINGVCIIGHGSSSPKAVCNAIRVARESITNQLPHHIVEAMRINHDRIQAKS